MSEVTEALVLPLPAEEIVEGYELEHDKVDALEVYMLLNGELRDFPLVNRFTNGMYIRDLFMPAGSLLTSYIHATHHPFTILTGRISVYEIGRGVNHYKAPHFGITKPGARRVLYVHEDTRWLTFHPNPNNETDISKLENILFIKRELADGKDAHQMQLELMAAGAGEAGAGALVEIMASLTPEILELLPAAAEDAAEPAELIEEIA